MTETTTDTTVAPVGILPDIELPAGLDAVLNTISDGGFWMRVGVITLGSVLVIIGLVLLMAGAKGVQDLAKLGIGVASKGIVTPS
jgi:hypothetical protein